MSEIVQFPERPDAEERRVKIERRHREQEQHAQHQAALLKQRRMLLERARDGRGQRKKMSKESERRAVARNLWDMLDRVEKSVPGQSKATILIAAGKAQPGDSTKHLERYALRPDLPEGEAAKKSARLVQAIQVYVDIARKAAELAGVDPDNAELEVLQGTQYLAGLPDERTTDPDARAADIMAEALRRMADRLSQDFSLQRYFELCERHRLVPESAEDAQTRFTVDEQGTLAGILLPEVISGARVKALDRCPGVYLGSVIAGDAVPGEASAIAITAENSEGFPIIFKVWRIPTWDVYLRIAPLGAMQSVIPIIDLRPVTRVKPAQKGWNVSAPDAKVWLDRRTTLGEHFGHPDSSLQIDILEPEGQLVPPMFDRPDDGDRLVDVCVLPSEGFATDASRKRRREATADLRYVCVEVLLGALLRPLFFRNQSDDGSSFAPTSWTDERHLGVDELRDYFFGAEEKGASPTVAAEGTLLARLERWMRGDMPFNDFHPGAVVRAAELSADLAERVSCFIQASGTVSDEAERRLNALLLDPKLHRQPVLPIPGDE